MPRERAVDRHEERQRLLLLADVSVAHLEEVVHIGHHVGVQLRVERSCPLPKTHNRLRQTHDLWHEMQAAYPEANEFVTKLNAFLTAARSVTFVLQKELSHQPWFPDWYGPWQDRMRGDPLMRWLVDARNTVEKQGDLDTASVAFVSLLLTDDERLLDRFEVPPLASPAEVAEAVKLAELPDRIRDQAVLAVERRWTVPELPNGELLDALAHCYGVLANLVNEAHERMGVRMQTFGGEEHGARHDRRPHPSGRLACMLSTAEARTAYWHLGERSLMRHVTKTLERSGPDALEQAADRYGIGGGQHGLMPGLSPGHRAAAMHSLGKRMLEVDGFHHTFAWLYRGDEQVAMLLLDPEDQQEKVVKIRRLAHEVERTGADSVLFTTEAWTAHEVDAKDPRAILRAGEREDRRELLATYLLRREGDHAAWITVFGRDNDGRVVLGETTEEPAFPPTPLFAPVLRIWKSWSTRDS